MICWQESLVSRVNRQSPIGHMARDLKIQGCHGPVALQEEVTKCHVFEGIGSGHTPSDKASRVSKCERGGARKRSRIAKAIRAGFRAEPLTIEY